MTLLNKTRMLNKILQKSGNDPVSFTDICTLLGDILESNVYIVSRKGKILGYSLSSTFKGSDEQKNSEDQVRFSEEFNEMMLTKDETSENLKGNGYTLYIGENQHEITDKISTMIPIVGNRERLGTLLLTRQEKEFTEEDLILSEYSTAIVGMEILRSKNLEMEAEARKKAIVQLAIGTLSYSELEAVEHIFRELDGSEGLLVASKIADKVGITRSVIVNALRKFESAGVIESRSLGMKGTHIKILNDKLMDELNKIK
ncbi:transcriptional pleiotropic repressor [Hathewaya proteolytica DSM 3090]|uniref:Global transcriptional regulator CodY n=1 Tax=Hathewaya proteolytica DSM 3090 TaxID=1121331 RepID=A0A1M6J755_9CLOT|nr:GTP-sensing pleiotropic transcriptional regulator CodY [Hathewaya proteolytica]SHJ42511.1 transcriptional pleiotropic repressor [Hathewaya proteolytica DSM 3090]